MGIKNLRILALKLHGRFKMRNKFILIGVFLLLISINFVSAGISFNATINSIIYLNRSQNTNLINISVGTISTNMSISNISFIIVNSQISFVNSSSRSDLGANVSFTNSTVGNANVLNFTAIGTNVTIGANSSRNFLFNVTPAVDAGSMSIIVNVTSNDTGQSDSNSTTLTFVVNFAFAGYVKNELGVNVSNANITIYQFLMNPFGPPTELAVATANSSGDGSFTLASINGSGNMYKLKIIQYNNSGTCNTACNATRTGNNLPPFPAMLFYPFSVPQGMPEWMKPPSLNGTSFYIQPAATLRLNATNQTGKNISFGYQVIDQALGFPIASNIRGNITTTTDIIVPAGRNYTVMFVRDPMQYSFSANGCPAGLDIFSCPSPPMSQSIANLVAGEIRTVTQNMSYSMYRLTGCLHISGNLSRLNVTKIVTKMVPWTGFVPPIKADFNTNLTTDYNSNITTSVLCNASNSIGMINLSLMGSTSGIQWLIEVYAKNSSNGDAFNSTTGDYYLALNNLTMNTSDQNLNMTLLRLAGSYLNNTGEANTSYITINIRNSSGGAITQDTPHIELVVRQGSSGATFGELHYIIESLTNGSFYLPFINGTTAKIKIYPRQSPPLEKTINLTQPVNNINLTGSVGFQRFDSSGEGGKFNKSEANLNDDNFNMNMRFVRNAAGCNLPNPSSSCEITSTNGSSFNPMMLMVAGKLNMEMKLPTNATIYLVNVDMLASGPPTNAIMNNDSAARTRGSSSLDEIWQFGSMAPSIYDYAYVGVPMNASNLNTSWSYNATIPYLYDENGGLIWNKTRGDTSANMTFDYAGTGQQGYNHTDYRNYTTSGQRCSLTDNTQNCFIDTTTRVLWMKIPHFSSIGGGISGSGSVSVSSADTSSSTSPGGGTSFWTTTHTITNEQFIAGSIRELAVGNRIKMSISGSTHYVGVVALTATTATINVSSNPQQATFSIGEEKKFEVTNDNKFDLSVKLNSIANNKANVTIKSISEEIPPVIAVNETAPTTTTPPDTTPTETKTNAALIAGIILAVIIIIIIIIIMGKKRYYK